MFSGSLIQHGGRWLHFVDPVATLVARRIEDVLPRLREAQERVNREGLWAAGFISYEAAPAFDPAVRTHPPGPIPLLWLALYPEPVLIDLPLGKPSPSPPYRWTTVDRANYDRAISRIRAWIEAGDTYQVNYTLRLRAGIEEDPRELFLRMITAHRPGYAAYLDCGRFVVCSASPELFFRLDGGKLTSRPMKGTSARGRWPAEDEARATTLAGSAKERAENVMIVDMVRNDMSRVARTGSVHVPSLFEVERYPVLWQMTSTVEAQTTAPVAEIMAALFPPASITGAPKPRTTEIIAELEATPRGAYTGCIGFIAPDNYSQFSVAIRTAVVDRSSRTVEYGVGSGIVWDSTDSAEYSECLLKARAVTDLSPEFVLLETIRWDAGQGYFLLNHHLQRLMGSAAYFGFSGNEALIRRRLDAAARGFPGPAQRVRLLLARDGGITLESAPLVRPSGPARMSLGIAPAAVDSGDPFLYHKTTHRKVYEEALAACPNCDDVVLWNERGEVTETTIANIVVESGGEHLTPALDCGLLPGTFRARLIEQGSVRESRITLEDLRRAQRIWLVNSVRGWREAGLAAHGTTGITPASEISAADR